MEVSGTFDMIVQGKVATLAEYTEQMALIGPQIAEFVTKIETNFVAKKIERHHESERFMWVPCVGGRKRIDIATIDKVIAEGDYMRLFVQDWHCLIHSTISALKEQLDARFIQLHRSSIVRIDFIERLMHRERRWIARLQDGSQQTVAKSHVAAVLQLAAYDSSKDMPKQSKSDTAVERGDQSDENELQRVR
jgi:DNA-binding LytR/AlgR family response regulator